MKKNFRLFVVSFLTVCFTVSVFAQKQKSKDEYIKEIAALSNSPKVEDKDKGYQLAKEFAAAYPKEKSDNAKKILDWMQRYRLNQMYTALENKNYAAGFALGRDILTDEPENTAVAMNLAYSAFDALSAKQDKTFADDAVKYGKLTLELLGKGSFPANFAPFENKDNAIAWMHYVIATFQNEKDQKDAALNYYKSTLYESPIKKSALPYFGIASYYESVYEKMSKDLNARVTAKTISDADYKAENEKIDKIIDLMMDAYARAYTAGLAEKNPGVNDWKTRLTQVYQYRKKTTAGLDAFINYVSTTPLVEPGK